MTRKNDAAMKLPGISRVLLPCLVALITAACMLIPIQNNPPEKIETGLTNEMVGMTEAQVIEQLGEPDWRDQRDQSELLLYTGFGKSRAVGFILSIPLAYSENRRWCLLVELDSADVVDRVQVQGFWDAGADKNRAVLNCLINLDIPAEYVPRITRAGERVLYETKASILTTDWNDPESWQCPSSEQVEGNLVVTDKGIHFYTRDKNLHNYRWDYAALPRVERFVNKGLAFRFHCLKIDGVYIALGSTFRGGDSKTTEVHQLIETELQKVRGGGQTPGK